MDLRANTTKCLVGRLGVPKRVNKEAFKSLLTRIWRTGGDIFFKEINENLWLFEFEDEKDCNKVLEGRSWSYDRTILIIEAIEGKKPPSQMKLHYILIWIQIHDMPLECMNIGVGMKIGDSLGPVQEVAVADDDVGWGHYLRIRVVLDLYKPLERGRALVVEGES